MSDLDINDDLVGSRVVNPARPEWGAGTVLRVQPTVVEGRTVQRVSVQFVTGHRTLVIPPGRLATPPDEPQRSAGWLDTAARRTLDEQLVALPEQVREFLGTSAQRIVVLARLYEIGEDAAAVLRWARSQSGVADPLSHWTRDELRAAFTEFCRRRDALLRDAANRLRSAAGPRAIHEVLDEVSPGARAAIEAVIK